MAKFLESTSCEWYLLEFELVYGSVLQFVAPKVDYED